MLRAQPLKLSALAAACMLAACALWPVTASAGLFDDEEARKAIVELRNRFEQAQQRQAQTEESDRKAQAAQVADLTEQINVLRRSLLDLNAQMETLRTELTQARADQLQERQRREQAETDSLRAGVRLETLEQLLAQLSIDRVDPALTEKISSDAKPKA